MKIILLSFVVSFNLFSMDNSQNLSTHNITEGEERKIFLLDVYKKIPTMTSSETYKDLLKLNPSIAESFLAIEQELNDINMLSSSL